MADENTALVADEGAQPPQTDIQADPPEEQREPTASELAAELGWKPKDQWQGPEDQWKPAAEFIKAGREIQHTYARDVKSLREQMDRMAGVTSKLIEDKAAERDAFWQSKLDEAVEAGDTKAAREIADKMKSADKPTQPQANPEVAQWVAKNGWYNTDPLAQARAAEISDRLKHLPVSEQLTQVERAIRKEFPEHFPKAKDPPATQTGAARTASPSNRQRGFADMPRESQQVARDMVRRHPDLKLEDFARNYWANEDKNKGRVSR